MCTCNAKWPHRAREGGTVRRTEDKELSKMGVKLLILAMLCLLHATAAQFDQCQVYYGGMVFPSGKRSMEHGIHLSKTQITKPAPDWNGTAVFNGEFMEMKLSDFRGKYLVFFFYPLDFTFVCPTEILALSDRIDEFKALNTEVVGCSVDSKYTHYAWISTPREEGGLSGLKIPLLSDLTKQISRDYGVLLDDVGHTLRGLFIIDAKGILRQITMNDLPVGRSVDETLRLVQAFQYTDQRGEVCPAGWKPGEKTIKPDPEAKKEYFSQAFCDNPEQTTTSSDKEN